jgi:3-isopropylmalate/(R)-2-methylmalate dehydratase large subunit
VDELSVLTNMTVEGGLMTGVVEPCQPIVDFLKARRGIDVHAAAGPPRPGRHLRAGHPRQPRRGAAHRGHPGDSRNRAPLSASTLEVAVHNVVIASCTGGSLADLRAAADVLQGPGLQPGVRVTVTPSSPRSPRTPRPRASCGLVPRAWARS